MVIYTRQTSVLDEFIFYIFLQILKMWEGDAALFEIIA